MDTDRSLDLVTCTINMRFAPEALEDAVRLLTSAVGRTGAKSGCRECVVTRDAAEEGRVRYCEAWDLRETFQRHLRSEEFGTVLVAMDLCLQEPEVMIGDLSGRRGISYLRELREGWDLESVEG